MVGPGGGSASWTYSRSPRPYPFRSIRSQGLGVYTKAGASLSAAGRMGLVQANKAGEPTLAGNHSSVPGPAAPSFGGVGGGFTCE